ncbi:MAG: hypothetical protein U0931_30110 [Vulcanimicrobiota bacterium]
MTYTPTGQLSPEIALEKVGRELAAWRESNRAPKPIPTVLWNQAAELGRALGAGVVARQLRLDYGCLKRKMVEGQPPVTTTQAKPNTNFLEFLAMPAPLGDTIESCTIRLRSPRAQVRVELQRLSPLALGTILKEALG